MKTSNALCGLLLGTLILAFGTCNTHATVVLIPRHPALKVFGHRHSVANEAFNLRRPRFDVDEAHRRAHGIDYRVIRGDGRVTAADLLENTGGEEDLATVLGGPSALDVDTDPATEVFLVTAMTGMIQDLNISVELGGLFDEFGVDSLWGDFRLTLTHVDTGTSAVFFDRASGVGGTFDATFDDEAGAVAPGFSGPLLGTYLPDVDSLSVFDGESVAGTWKLSLLDQVTNGDGDDLISWSLDVEVIPEPSRALLSLVGLGAIGLRRRRG